MRPLAGDSLRDYHKYGIDIEGIGPSPVLFALPSPSESEMDRHSSNQVRRRRQVILPFVLICFISAVPTKLWAQLVPPVPIQVRTATTASTANTTTYTGSLMQSAVRQGWIRYGVRFGRVRPVANNRSSIQSRSTNETLSIMGGLTQQLSVIYRYENGDKVFTFVSSNDTLLVTRQAENPTDKDPTVEFHQPKQGQPELRIADGESRKTYRAETIWHLYFDYPEVCQQQLDPLLAGLRSGPPLSETVKLVEKALVQRSKLDRSSPVDRWRVLVEQLGSDSFAVRRAADAELRESGQAAIAFLLSYEMRDLDPEQQMRVRRIIRSLQPGEEEDSPDRAAAYLFSQPTAWVSLLGSDNLESRTVAKEELERLLERTVDFDPSATEEERAEQINVIRSTLM